jgi:hypothetical protein
VIIRGIPAGTTPGAPGGAHIPGGSGGRTRASGVRGSRGRRRAEWSIDPYGVRQPPSADRWSPVRLPVLPEPECFAERADRASYRGDEREPTSGTRCRGRPRPAAVDRRRGRAVSSRHSRGRRCGLPSGQVTRQTQPRVKAPAKVARQYLSPIGSWLANGWGQTSHATSGGAVSSSGCSPSIRRSASPVVLIIVEDVGTVIPHRLTPPGRRCWGRTSDPASGRSRCTRRTDTPTLRAPRRPRRGQRHAMLRHSRTPERRAAVPVERGSDGPHRRRSPWSGTQA